MHLIDARMISLVQAWLVSYVLWESPHTNKIPYYFTFLISVFADVIYKGTTFSSFISRLTLLVRPRIRTWNFLFSSPTLVDRKCITTIQPENVRAANDKAFKRNGKRMVTLRSTTPDWQSWRSQIKMMACHNWNDRPQICAETHRKRLLRWLIHKRALIKVTSDLVTFPREDNAICYLILSVHLESDGFLPERENKTSDAFTSVKELLSYL